MIVGEWGSVIPENPAQLQQLPGIGPYTAGAIAAFAFNRAEIFLETNIRAVLLHFFFYDQVGITDKQLVPIAGVVLDCENPRTWYNALMDYGSDLKRRFPNPSRRSRHHSVQSRFEGSDRQVRGAILKLLLKKHVMSVAELAGKVQSDSTRVRIIIGKMASEGIVREVGFDSYGIGV
jgi:A/G-specific adenine glycosylase